MIAAGGTAGHVVPAIAVADALRAEGAEVSFVGGERAEAELVPAAGYELDRIEAEGISRTNPVKAARAVMPPMVSAQPCSRRVSSISVSPTSKNIARIGISIFSARAFSSEVETWLA